MTVMYKLTSERPKFAIFFNVTKWYKTDYTMVD